MNTELMLGEKVVFPMTDSEGETAFAVGELKKINSRWATVLYEAKLVKVGCSKVERFVPPRAKEHLVTTEDVNRHIVRTAKGRLSVDNGDGTAVSLRGLNLDEVYAVAARELKTTEQSLRKRYGKLNNGQQRMCLGNRIRSKARRHASHQE